MSVVVEPAMFVPEADDPSAGEVRVGPGTPLRIAQYFDERAGHQVDEIVVDVADARAARSRVVHSRSGCPAEQV